MSSVIENDAKQFGKGLVPHASTVGIAKINIDKRIQNYTTSQNKYLFLKTLRLAVDSEYLEHKAKCTKQPCDRDRSYEAVSFVINQEIDSILEYFTPGEVDKASFSGQDKYEVSSKINEVLDQLNKLGLGQEILFNEINSMKEHLNLDKKSWTQLLKGKLVDVAQEKIVEVAILNTIYQTITQSIRADQFVLPQ